MSLLGRFSHVERMRRVAEVFALHGATAIFERLGLHRFPPLARHLPKHAGEGGAPHLRMALEDLGTTFVKVGQVLSTRGDLLPREYQAELAKLQDAATPVPFDEIERAIIEELGAPPSELFAAFDREPLAAASIGQAHAARLPDGTEVVVKVRRPGVVELVERDLEILRNLAAGAAQRSEVARRYDLPGLADELGDTLRSELDYLQEARNADAFRTAFADDPSVRIPRVVWDRTTSRVLTLERIRGTKITDLAALDDLGIDRPKLAVSAARVVARMVFEIGVFHADPHPGNFFVEADGRLGLLDFGMVGRLDEPTRDRLVGVLLAVSEGDEQRLVDEALDLGIARGPVDRPRLGADLGRLASRWTDRPLGEVRMGPLFEDIHDLLRRHRLVLPPRLALLVKTLVMEESLGALLDPGFQLTTVLEPYADEMVSQRLSPSRLLRRAGRATRDLAQLSSELPRRVRRVLGDVERGGLSVGVRPQDFGPVLDRLDALANRIVFGVVVAAFVVGLATLTAAWRPPGLERWLPLAFGLGLLMVLALGARIAWGMIRSKRRD